MEKQDFVGYLSQKPKQFRFEEKELEGKFGVLVENRFHQTKTFFAEDTIAAEDLKQLLIATHQGKNIEHITRVTGYFSKVSGWNKGKVAELIDRYRAPIS